MSEFTDKTCTALTVERRWSIFKVQEVTVANPNTLKKWLDRYKFGFRESVGKARKWRLFTFMDIVSIALMDELVSNLGFMPGPAAKITRAVMGSLSAAIGDQWLCIYNLGQSFAIVNSLEQLVSDLEHGSIGSIGSIYVVVDIAAIQRRVIHTVNTTKPRKRRKAGGA